MGFFAFIVVLLLDVLKGGLSAGLIPGALRADPAAHATWGVLFGVSAIAGHAKPVFLLWRGGGKGVATAAGCQLVASCDLAIASEQATFATPGVDIGLFCSTPMVALSRNVPRKNAMHMLLTGEPVPADEARAIGLINRVVPHGSERAAAIALAESIAGKSAYTVRIGKEAFYRQAELGLADAYAYASQVMTENMMARDAEEGIDAFIQKRHPTWCGA